MRMDMEKITSNKNDNSVHSRPPPANFIILKYYLQSHKINCGTQNYKLNLTSSLSDSSKNLVTEEEHCWNKYQVVEAVKQNYITEHPGFFMMFNKLHTKK
jgi:hypothetical protein